MLELRDIAEKGDLIAFLNEDGEVYHWALITDIGNGAIMYAAHTDNVTRRPLKTNFYIKLIKLKRQNP